MLKALFFQGRGRKGHGPILSLAAILPVLVALYLGPPALAAPFKEGASAAVVMYHRFGETKYPSTSITLDQFEAHLNELKTGPYKVLPLPEIVAALRSGAPLADRTVGLSIDDAYLSVYTEAWPRLKAAGLPFTLFVATDPVDQGLPGYMSWDQLREMVAGGVTIGSQSASHPHLPNVSAERVREEIERANARIEAELGSTPTLFAYPFGEAGLKVETLVSQAGFSAAFGQHSGAIGGERDLFYLPRFSMNKKYGTLDRLRLAVNSRALPVTEVTPQDTLVTDNNPPAIGFTVSDTVKGLGALNCFASHEGRVEVTRLGDTRIEVRLKTPFPKGRGRLNCTLPAEDGRWRWLGRQFYIPK